ncbi:MAG: L-fucose:H+ symporter permease [Bacteroidetes bacterium]|nr:MAG: L-fucose:H+ symporter permease [Bacteroidota bacterium]
MKSATNKYLWPLILITSLFFLWALAHNLNDILIKQFQKALDINRGQAGFIQFAFYLGYFVMAIPAGLLMKKIGYKKGILTGLLLYATGALLFFPAAEIRLYGFFLFALFIIASGLTFLETAANPYITKLGNPDFAARRLNFAQSFNGLGAVLAPALGGYFIFSGNNFSSSQLVSMDADTLLALRVAEAKAVQWPYFAIAMIVLAIAVLIYKTPMPEIKEDEQSKKMFSKDIFRHKHLVHSIIAQFFYVGAQVGIWSYFIDFMIDVVPGTSDKTAAYFLSISLVAFMIGRFSGSFLMTYIRPNRLLAIYAAASIGLLIISTLTTGMISVYALIGVSFFMSIMFPTIFALGIKDLGEDTKIGSSLIIMSIIGGAIFPLIMGYVGIESIKTAFLVPIICFLFVLMYGIKWYKVQGSKAIAL